MFKMELGQIIQIATLLLSGATAWYSLSTDMALIKQKLEIDAQTAAKVEARIGGLEQRITDVENTQRDLWHDVRGSHAGKR